MTLDQALENLNQAAASASLSRGQHITVMQSYELLKKAIKVSKPVETKPEDDNGQQQPVNA